jgi:hypothetical protein
MENCISKFASNQAGREIETMKASVLATTFSVLAVALIAGAGWQRQKLNQLRGQNQRIVSELEKSKEISIAIEAPTESMVTPSAHLELMRLRNEVTQLMQRKQALNNIESEHQRLQVQISKRGTNSNTLPPGYILKRNAQWMGMNTPENTLQSFLWAIQNRNTETLFQLLKPEDAKRLKDEIEQSGKGAEEFFAASPPGARILQQKTLPDGSIEMELEFLPGVSGGNSNVRFYQLDGGWRLDLP